MIKFTTHAAAIINATSRADSAWVKASEVTAMHIMQYIDANVVDGLARTVENAKLLGTEVRAGFEKYVMIGAIKKATVSNYAQGAQRAFFHNVDWTPRAFQQPELALPGGKAKPAKSGTVTKTNSEALVKTLVKALEQCRTIGNDATAAGIVDLICEIKPDFTEQTAE